MLKNNFDIEELRTPENQESEPLIPATTIEDILFKTSKNLFEICSEERWKIADGALNSLLGTAFVGMSTMKEVAESEGMMWIHAALGGILSAKIIRTLAEAGSSIYYRNHNVAETAVEINLFQKLATIEGQNRSLEILINKIDDVLKKSDKPLSEELKTFLKQDLQTKTFVDLTNQVSEVSNQNLLFGAAILGIACTAAGAVAMSLTANSLPAAITTGAGLMSSPFLSATLNASASRSNNIAENTYQAIKLLNEEVFSELKNNIEAHHNLPENLERMRDEIRIRRPIKTNSSSRVLVENDLGNSL